jgi:hypothetical protein
MLSFKKKEKGREFIYLFYLFCPGGAAPDGFWFSVSVSCVNPEPVHDGCCPPGELPPPFVQPVSVVTGVILAATGAATDDTSMATDSATAIAASAVNVTLCVFMSYYHLSHLYKRVLGDF